MAIVKNVTFTNTGAATLPSGPETTRPACKIDSYTTVGSYTWTAPSYCTSVEVLVVAGGGGGGWDVGGGGGAGGVIYNASFPVTPNTGYTVVVGAGGAGANAGPNRFGSRGSNSQFSTLIAIGGGGAGGWSDVPATGGGSGGGQTSNRRITDVAPGTPGQGFPGGRSSNYGSNANYTGASGGGGAQMPGGDGEFGGAWEQFSNKFGYGGHGLAFAISGQMTYYGGGGGGTSDNATFFGVGGLGGGGSAEGNGTANTGGGGGGGGLPTNVGGTGGTGIVIVKYHDPRVLMFGTPGTYSWTAPTGVTSLSELLIVAGGGAGGAGTGGGGGAGGVVYYGSEGQNNFGASFSVTPGNTYTIVVGSGGAAGTGNSNGGNGGNSSFTGATTAVGGGGGGGDGSSGSAGGSAGGTYQASTGSATSTQGNAGGVGPGGVPYGSGGGGGATEAGQNSNFTQNNGGTYIRAQGGQGGQGRLTRIAGHYMFVAGGGGGAGYAPLGGGDGWGGRGGGGRGTNFGEADLTHTMVGGPYGARINGIRGTGGGGGGGGEMSWPPNRTSGRYATSSGLNQPSGAGGSGLVILKSTTNPLVTDTDIVNGSLNGYWYYNTSKNVPEIYSKGSFRDASIADLDGTKPELAAPSARHIKRLLGDAATTGYYWINIRGTPTLTHCNMDLGEGGWMLGMNINTSDGSFVHFSNHQFWEDPQSLTRFPSNTRPTGNPFACFRRDFKAVEGGNLWQNYPGTELMIVVHSGGDGSGIFGWRSWNLNIQAVTKFSQFWNGTRYYSQGSASTVQYLHKITDGSTGWRESGTAGTLSSRTPNSYEPDDLVTNAANGFSDSNRLTQVNPGASKAPNSTASYSRTDNQGAGFGTYYDTSAGGRPESDGQNWDTGTWVNAGGGYFGSDTLNNSNFSSWSGKEQSGGGGDTYNWQNANGFNYNFAMYIR